MKTPLLFALVTALCAPAAAANFQGVVSHVTDGDTLWVRPDAGGPPRQVRLLGVDAPEICQAYGRAARAALHERALHRRVTVASPASDSFKRALGTVRLGSDDLGAWMVKTGHAWSYRFRKDPGPYAQQQATARQQRLGLWAAGAAIEPRVFRQRQGPCGSLRGAASSSA